MGLRRRRANHWWFGAALLAAFFATPAAAQDAPLIEQIHIDPDGVSFIEISNRSAEPLSLDGFHLSTAADYFAVVSGDGVMLGDSDFLVGFPEGFELPTGELVVQLSGTGQAFLDAFGFEPDLSVDAPDLDGTQEMVAIGNVGTGPSREAGLMVLFFWDGDSDLVADADMVFWGDGPRVDKTDQAVDGPDDGDETTAFAPDTATADQLPAPVPEAGQALHRIDGEESETLEGGNGIDGHDETSEDLGAAFEVGEPAPVAHVIIAGTVTGEGSAGASLSFVGDETFEATAGDDGVFALQLPAGATLDLSVSQGEDTLLDGQAFEVGTANRTDVVIALGELTISGTVTTRGGDAEPTDLTITIDETGQSQALGEAGQFSFVVEPGDYTLVVSGPGVGINATPVSVTDAPIEGVEITVDIGFALSGTVLGPDGAPVAATITIEETEETIEADAEGLFTVTLPAGIYTVLAEAEGFQGAERVVDLSRGAADIELTLASGETFSLIVDVATPDGPATGATLTVNGGPVAGAGIEVQTDAAGRATVPDLLAGRYSVAIELEGHYNLTIETVPVGSDVSLSAMLVPLTRQPTVEDRNCQAIPGGRSPAGWPLVVLMLVGLAWRQRAGKT